MACKFWLTYQNAEIMPVAILLSRATAKVLIAVWWMSGLDWAWKQKQAFVKPSLHSWEELHTILISSHFSFKYLQTLVGSASVSQHLHFECSPAIQQVPSSLRILLNILREQIILTCSIIVHTSNFIHQVLCITEFQCTYIAMVEAGYCTSQRLVYYPPKTIAHIP